MKCEGMVGAVFILGEILNKPTISEMYKSNCIILQTFVCRSFTWGFYIFFYNKSSIFHKRFYIAQSHRIFYF